MDLIPFRKGFDEHILVDVADAKFGEDGAEVGDLDVLLLLPSASDSTTRLEPGPEDPVVPEELGADQR